MDRKRGLDAVPFLLAVRRELRGGGVAASFKLQAASFARPFHAEAQRKSKEEAVYYSLSFRIVFFYCSCLSGSYSPKKSAKVAGSRRCPYRSCGFSLRALLAIAKEGSKH
jgi:hypothetical protein